MVAELPDSDLWGAMMLQELPKVAVAMVSLAMVALLVSLARNLMKELVKKEHVERVALAEVEVPELWYSPYGERTHATRTCHGLRNATSVHRVLPCRYCCPNQMRLREQKIVEHRRTFYEAAGKYLWFKLAVIVILMSMLHRSVCSVLCEKRVWLHLVLLYSHMQCAVAMEEALQRLTELTAQNTQQIQALAQAMNNQQAQAGTASQQVQELAQSMAQHQRAITEATQATNTALSQQAELTANAAAATGKLTADAVTALSQHAESRRPGEVDLHKMIKSPEVFGPTTYREERDGFLEFRLKMRSWIGALNPDILKKIEAVELDRREETQHKNKRCPRSCTASSRVIREEDR
eukprot:s8952_g1.t1